MLHIENLHAEVQNKPILRGLNLSVQAGQVHAIMGPNGAGKSTLSKLLAGHADYTVTAGQVTLDGQNLLDLEPEARAHAGIFLGFQYPVEIPGVSNMALLKAAVHAQRKARGLAELPTTDLLALVKKCAQDMKIDPKMLQRGVNEGFSGGEKKRNEILQMLVLQPRLMLLDETDSGLDIDALRVVADGINLLRSPERATVLVTHYQRLLDYVKPDFVHVLAQGQIVKSGGPELALQLEAEGYAGLVGAAA